MNKKCLFGITNALLVGIIGLIVGLFCSSIFATGVGVAAFVCFLVSLCVPSVIYFGAAKAGTPLVVICLLLIVAELGVNIPFMVNPNIEAKIFGIVQAIVVGLFLVAALVIIAVSGKKEEDK